ncbi:hypothetical protein PMAYCL1PPCAC_03299, partial [Pristionchus mayeri]
DRSSPTTVTSRQSIAMATSLKVDVSIMPDFPTPPPHSDASSTTSSSTSSPSSSSSTSSKERSTVACESATPPPSASSSSSCPYGPDYDQNGHKIKRPMNAFMVWAQMRRAEITAVSSKVHNSTISKALGVEWREMSEADKQPYVQKAKELRDELFREHPHYVYRPRKRKTRSAPYSPRPAAMQNTTASLPAGSATGLAQAQLLLAPSPCSATPQQTLAALLLPQPSTTAADLQQLHQPAAAAPADAAASLAHPQMPLFAPGLLQQLQHSAALAAVLQQQQPTAPMMNPLLLNLFNPLLAQMLTQLTSTTTP